MKYTLKSVFYIITLLICTFSCVNTNRQLNVTHINTDQNNYTVQSGDYKSCILTNRNSAEKTFEISTPSIKKITTNFHGSNENINSLRAKLTKSTHALIQGNGMTQNEKIELIRQIIPADTSFKKSYEPLTYERPTHWSSIASLTTSILAITGILAALLFFSTFLLFPAFWLLSIPLFSILAIIFGIIGIVKSGSNKKYRNKAMAIVGLSIGGASLIFYLFIILIALLFFLLFQYK